MLRGAIIGFGRMGLTHFSILNNHLDVQFVTVCDTSSFMLKYVDKYTGIEPFKDYRKMIGVAAVFDYHTGNAKYAPKWIQRIGMEWLYRLFHEPRMLIRNVRSFAFMFEAITAGMLNRRSSRYQGCSDNEHGLRHGDVSWKRKTTK